MADLAGVHLKLSRAYEHFEAFKSLEVELSSKNIQYAMQGYNHELGRYEFIIQDDWRIPESCPLVIGDCLYNARSCLDHLAWQLARKPGRNTYFPLHDSLEQFESKAMAQMLTMKPSAQSKIEELQKYNRPDLWLDLLHELNLTDKHRLLLVTAMRPAGSVATGGLPDSVSVRFTDEPFMKGSVFMTSEMPFDPELHASYLPIGEIAFGEAPAKRRGVQYVLYKILHDIETVVLPSFRPDDFW